MFKILIHGLVSANLILNYAEGCGIMGIFKWLRKLFKIKTLEIQSEGKTSLILIASLPENSRSVVIQHMNNAEKTGDEITFDVLSWELNIQQSYENFSEKDGKAKITCRGIKLISSNGQNIQMTMDYIAIRDW
jgi:hypothetical protein